MTQEYSSDDRQIKPHKTETAESEKTLPGADSNPVTEVTGLQQMIGNRAVQRLLAQRSGDGPFDLNDETADRINRERGSGQALDNNVQARMSEATGQDLSGVKVHTGPESHALNESLSAKAFTTGHDIFFREGAYDPGSSGGQELLAHELTHVVQQSSGRVGGGGGGMTVNAPGDAYEQEADSVAKAVTSTASAPALQRQEISDEDEDVQTKTLQRQEISEEDQEEE
jgi:hypothetical protein